MNGTPGLAWLAFLTPPPHPTPPGGPMLLGIDISHHNPDLDYARAHAEGAAFIVHKATEGSAPDPTYARRAAAIRASGAVPGAYHFLRSTASAAAQVQHFLDVIGDPAG